MRLYEPNTLGKVEMHSSSLMKMSPNPSVQGTLRDEAAQRP